MSSEKYPYLGFDPARGNVATLRDLATEIGKTATYASEAHDALVSINKNEGVWTGEAAKAFSENIEDLPGYLDDAHSSMESANRALSKWANELEQHQREAARLEEEARKAIAIAEQADAEVRRGGYLDLQQLENSTTFFQAQQAANIAWNNVENIRRAAEQLLETWLEDSAVCAKALREAGETAPEEGFFEAIGNFIASHMSTLADVAGIISSIAGALSFIPGLNAIAAPIALVSGLVSLGANAADITIKGEWDDPMSYVSIVGDGLSVIPGAGKVGKATISEVVDAARRGGQVAADEGGSLIRTFNRNFSEDMLKPGETADLITQKISGAIGASGPASQAAAQNAAKVLDAGVDLSLQTPTAIGLFNDSDSVETAQDAATHGTTAIAASDRLIKWLT